MTTDRIMTQLILIFSNEIDSKKFSNDETFVYIKGGRKEFFPHKIIQRCLQYCDLHNCRLWFSAENDIPIIAICYAYAGG